MRGTWMFAFSAVLAVIFFSWPAGAQNMEQRLRDILLTSSSIGGPTFHEEIRTLQKVTGATDDEIGTLLKQFIQNAIQEENDPSARFLAANAILVIVHYGNSDAQALLESIIKDTKGPLRHRAIESYLCLNEHQISGPIAEVLESPEHYDDLDRRAVYEEIERAYYEAQKTNDQDKKRSLLLAVSGVITNETDISNVVLLDKFLAEQKKGYRKSEVRRELLRRHYHPDERTQTTDHKYIADELAEFAD